MEDLQLSISKALKTPAGKYCALSSRTAFAEIPSYWLEKSTYTGRFCESEGSPKCDSIAKDLQTTAVVVTVLKCEECYTVIGDDPSEDTILPKSFSSTLFYVAKATEFEVRQNIVNMHPNSCHYRLDCENVPSQSRKTLDLCKTFLKGIFCPKIVEPHQLADLPFEENLSGRKRIPSSANLKQPLLALLREDMIYLVYSPLSYTVKDTLMYSPCKLPADSVKTSFVLFQVLQFFYIFEQKFFRDLSSLSWNDVEIDIQGWIQVKLPEKSLITTENKNHEHCTSTEEVNLSGKEPEHENLSEILDKWLCGETSNFDYLMFLNKLAGRTVHDPNHHPILPWVSTLETENSSWRDLTKTKYRLTKGDKQLDIQYSMMSDSAGVKSSHSQPNLHQSPHHVPEFLSDITYYVYMARRTSKSILCKLVRSYWEPNEYPSSIQRMQEWTPDECIPEFYNDPTVFESLHEDMNNLSVPSWCEDAADFIRKHRAMLESDIVSQNLHHWIDVTFGYKLSGKDAVDAKNVCLPLVDNHTALRNRGITQLFDSPHPQKRAMKQGSDGPEITLNNSDKDQSSLSHASFDPTGGLSELEKLLKFKVSLCGDPIFSFPLASAINYSEHKSLKKFENRRNLSERNLKAFMCLLVELFLPLETMSIAHGMSMESRIKLCLNIFMLHHSKFPSPFRYAMRCFIDSFKKSNNNPCRSDDYLGNSIFKTSSERGHPPPTVGLLSSPYIHSLPFPIYFHELYELLEVIMSHTLHYSKPLAFPVLADISNRLRGLLEKLYDTEECLEILVPHICKVLQQETNSAVAFLVLNFETIAKAMSEKQLNADILPLMLRLYDTLLEVSAKSCSTEDGCSAMQDQQCGSFIREYYGKKFLLQLCTRLGLKAFLQDIPRCLANALIHQSDSQISETSKQSIFWLMDRIGPTLTSKYIVRHLFRVLSLCFMSADGLKSNQYTRVRDCLLHAAELFGHSIITLQYFPHLIHNISSAVFHPKFALRHQAAVESSVVTVSHLITYLTDTVLMQELSRISNDILIPVIELLGRSDLAFPGSISSRKSLCLQVVHLMTLVVVRIGREMSRKHLTSLFRTFFAFFPCGDDVTDRLATKSSSSDRSFDSLDSDSVIIDHDADTKTYRTFESTRRGRNQLHKSWFNESPSSSPNKGSPILRAASQHESSEAKDEILATFCAETAYRSFVSFTRVLGGIHMEKVLGNFHDHIHKLSLQHEKTLVGGSILHSAQPTGPSHYHADITMVGNQLVVDSPSTQSFGQSCAEQNFDIMSTLLESSGGVPTEDKLGGCLRRSLKSVLASQLTENWLAYWEHEIGLPDNDKHIHFNQIELQSFGGHAGAVRCISCHPSEDWFVSGGKDKAVKIWSVPENMEHTKRNFRHAVMNENYAYRMHRKAISYVGIAQSEQLIISNDGNIHVWDPYTCQQVTTFDNTDVKSGFALVTTLPSPFRCALTVTSEGDLRVIDFRQKLLAHEFKIVIGTSMGLARAICVLEDGNRAAIGLSTGMVSSIDVRMGNRLAIKPAHEGDISTMVAVSEKRYLTASSDQSVVLWECGRQAPINTYRSFQEPIHTAEIFNGEIISGSMANRVCVHALPSTYDGNDSFMDKPIAISKLRNDTFRGVMTTFCVLPMKRQLLLASDSGSIKLMA